nr:hypothetical protein BaRGS_022494 [Batillaria attramentaria]
MRSATGTYVIAISIGQLVHVLSQFIYTNIWPDAVDQPKAALAYCLYYWYVMIYLGVVIARRGSHIIMCMASVERLYAVVRPLHIKNFFLSKRPVLGVVITYSALAVWHVFYLVKHDITMVEMSNGEQICIVGLSAAYHTSRFVIDTFETISRVLFAYLSLVLQLMLNVLTVWGLRRHNMTTKHVQSSASEEAKRQKERQLTVTLMAATITYVSLALPAAIVNVVSTLVWVISKTGQPEKGQHTYLAPAGIRTPYPSIESPTLYRSTVLAPLSMGPDNNNNNNNNSDDDDDDSNNNNMKTEAGGSRGRV